MTKQILTSTDSTDTSTITHKSNERRFDIVIDGYTAYVEYVIDGKTFDIIHTIVPKTIGGRGIAAQLVKKAYAFADDNGLEYRASCSYAATWLKRYRK